MEGKKRLHDNQITKGLQSNLNNKVRLNNKISKDKKNSNLIDKYNKKKLHNVVKLDKTNLYCLDKSNQHCIQVL